MKKLIAVFLIVFSILTLAGCDGGTGLEIPEGMQLVKESKEDGFIFFGPAAWIIANQGEVYCTYLSGINTTSITFTSVEISTESMKDYFNRTRADFPYKDSMNISVDGERVNFGNADEAYKYVYSYKYGDYDIACLQILVRHGDKHFVFTYTSYGDISDETSYYRTYLDRAQKVIDNFKFTESTAEDSKDEPEYETDSDGYILISDKAVSGFDLYVPKSAEVLDSSAIVSARIGENSMISLTRATETGVNILHYLSARHDEMAAITEGFTDIEVKVTVSYNEDSPIFEDWNISVMPTVDDSLRFGDLEPKTTAAYEYSFEWQGEKYHVYQLLGVGRFDGYVFTYTSTEADYNKDLGIAEKIIEKVKFN